MTCVQAAVSLSQLDRTQRDKLFKGETIMLEEQVENAPWPRLKIFRLVDANVEDFAAFFTDFERQKTYIPNLVKSKVTKENGIQSVEVSYELNLPWPISNAIYLHGHAITKMSTDHYKVSWHVIKSSVADQVTGLSEFVKFKDKTLWYYENFTLPKSGLAGLFEGSMKVDTMASLDATLKAFMNDRMNNPDKLKHSLEIWRKRLLDSTK